MTNVEFKFFKTMLEDGNPLKRDIKYIEHVGEGFTEEDLADLSLEECLKEALDYFNLSKY